MDDHKATVPDGVVTVPPQTRRCVHRTLSPPPRMSFVVTYDSSVVPTHLRPEPGSWIFPLSQDTVTSTWSRGWGPQRDSALPSA